VALTELNRRQNINAVVERWRERCLVEDGSLLYSEDLWIADNLARVYHNIVQAPLLEHDRSFIDKLEEQLKGDRELIILGAEALIVYYLFPWYGAVSAQTKRGRVNQVLAWAGEELSEDSDVWRAFGDQGIGHPGRYFLSRPDVQVGFLLDFANRLKSTPAEERRGILDEPWRLRDFADDGAEDGAAGMRHIVLHLLQPEFFERISSGEHKQSITSTYAGFVSDGEIDDVDEQLLQIRNRLVEVLKKPADEVDFYLPPLAGTWGSGRAGDATDPIEALELKKQVVLFGPPGTSKTYEAKQLAAQIIRRQALKLWGPVAYFQKQERVEELLGTHVHRLQLHPAYSHEEFIRGLRLRDGTVAFEDGYLLRLIQEIEGEHLPEGEKPLPWVLILDELNRADLSRVFGEAFSVLEDRNSDVELLGTEPGEPPALIRLPERLYLIGTMNLIDQSLEQIDFALRRRFLWWRSSFDRQRLADVLPELWEKTPMAKRYAWERISEDMERFIARAELLNQQIAASSLLGRDYEIGHTYFFDVVGLLARAEYMNRKTRASRFLWTAKGEARPAVTDLWRMSLEPLLDQYLQGVDAESRRAELTRLSKVFLNGET
jgi:5-methylcytosine-specific restriction enzyme B